MSNERAIIDARTDTVLNLIVMGLTRREILRYVTKDADPPWDVCNRSVDRYIAAAKKIIEKAAEVNIQRELGLSSKRLEDLYKRNISIQDYKGALAVQKERNELFGLKKQGIDINHNFPASFADFIQMATKQKKESVVETEDNVDIEEEDELSDEDEPDEENLN